MPLSRTKYIYRVIKPKFSFFSNMARFASGSLVDFDANLLHKDLVTDMVHHVSVAQERANVQLFVVPGSDLEDSTAALALARDPEMGSRVVATVGVHPYNSERVAYEESSLDKLRALVLAGNTESGDGVCRAVGECGLDYTPGFPTAEFQLPWFRAQVSLALEQQLPLFLHVRDAQEDFLSTLVELGFPEEGPPPVSAVVHCFTGTTDELHKYVRMGFYIGLTGYAIGVANKKDADSEVEDPLVMLKEWLRIIPLNRLVLETDAPYMGFKGCRSTENKKKNQKYPNVPAAMKIICEHIATASDRPYDDVANSTTENARRFFGLSI